jgi:hypothetical protein
MSELQPIPKGEDAKNIIKANRILCAALMIGCSFFAIIVLTLMTVSLIEPTIDAYAGSILLIVLIVLAGVCFVIARKNYNKSITSAKDSLNTMTEKLNAYRLTLIIYMAMCEGPALFGVIAFFLSGNYFTLVVTAIMLLAMLSKFPTVTRVVTDLGLSSQEQIELE